MDSKRYEPTSPFLVSFINGEIVLSDSDHGKANLAHLINMTQDTDVTNRDWATMLLSQQEIDTEAVRDALLHAARDENDFVRAEAILGLASRDKATALPLIKNELSLRRASVPIFEAAMVVADPSLIDDLRPYTEPSGDDYLDGLVLDALAACQV